jgi:hypothetical protein
MKMLIAVVVLSLGCSSCFAQDVDAAKRAKVEAMLSAMHVDKMSDQMMGMAKAQIAQAQQGMPELQAMTPKQRRIFDDYQAKMLQLVVNSLSWKAMEPEMVKLYVKTFTDKEIDDISAFYMSPTGQALLEKTPQLMSGITQFVQGRVVELQPGMKAMTDQFVKDMTAAGVAATPKKS